MAKEMVSIAKYLELINEEVKKDNLYEEGMEVVEYPEGATGRGVSGYSFKGGFLAPMLLGDAIRVVDQKYSPNLEEE